MKRYIRATDIDTGYNGRWLPYAENNGVTTEYVCSVCRRLMSATGRDQLTDTCPCCGAKLMKP